MNQPLPVDRICSNCGDAFRGYYTSKYCKKPECQKARRDKQLGQARTNSVARRMADKARREQEVVNKAPAKLHKCLRCDKWQEDRVCKPCQRINSTIPEDATYVVSPTHYRARIHRRGSR